MLGSIIGAGVGAAASIFGGISASKAIKKMKANLEEQRKKNQNWYVERPLYFDPFGQTGFAPVGHNIIAPCKVLVQGSILFYPFRYSGFSWPSTYACFRHIILWYAPYE